MGSLETGHRASASWLRSVYLIGVLAPPFFSNYQFQDSIKTIAQMNTYSAKSEDAIREEVFKKAQELDVPIVKEQIKIVRTGTAYAGSISIDAPYIRACEPAWLPDGSELRSFQRKPKRFLERSKASSEQDPQGTELSAIFCLVALQSFSLPWFRIAWFRIEGTIAQSDGTMTSSN